jgi:hypothetical protein
MYKQETLVHKRNTANLLKQQNSRKKKVYMSRKAGNIGRLCRISPLIADHRSEASAVVLAGTDTASYREKEQRLLLLPNYAPPGWVQSSVNYSRLFFVAVPLSQPRRPRISSVQPWFLSHRTPEELSSDIFDISECH